MLFLILQKHDRGLVLLQRGGCSVLLIVEMYAAAMELVHFEGSIGQYAGRLALRLLHAPQVLLQRNFGLGLNIALHQVVIVHYRLGPRHCRLLLRLRCVVVKGSWGCRYLALIISALMTLARIRH